MFLLPVDITVIVICIAVAVYAIFLIFLINTEKKTLPSRELLDIIHSMSDIITGGHKMETKDTNLNEFVIGETVYKIEDNKLNLEDLVLQNDNDEDYEDYLAVVTNLLRERYEKFRFLRISPTHGDYNSGYFLSFTITREQVPVEYEYLFRLAVSKGLTDSKINDLFYKAVKSGKVLPLGDVEIVVGTGISPVTQADDLMANIVFMPRDYYEKHLELKEKAETDGTN